GPERHDLDIHVLALAAVIFDHVLGVVKREIHDCRIVLIDLNGNPMRLVVRDMARGHRGQPESQGNHERSNRGAHRRDRRPGSPDIALSLVRCAMNYFSSSNPAAAYACLASGPASICRNAVAAASSTGRAPSTAE